MADDLEVLFPDEVVEVAGGPVTIHPFYFGQLSRVVKFCRPVVKALLESGIMTVTVNTDNTSTITIDQNFIPKLFTLLDDAVEPLMGLVAFALGKPREWLDKLPMDVGIELTQKIWEINSNFFVKRVMPILAKQFSQFRSAGATSSPVSSEPVIDATTSTNTL